MQYIKTIIENAIREHQTEVIIYKELSQNDVYYAIRQVMRENPDIFWFSHQWHFSELEARVKLRYTIDKKRCEKITKQIEDVIMHDFRLLYTQNLSAQEKVMYIYKWIAIYCNYNIHSAHNQTIYSVFVHRHSVCTGIAKAAQHLLKLVGIECKLVFGKMNNSEKDSRHCWLIINLEGQWYHLDPTFAFPETEQMLHKCGIMPVQGDDLLFYNFFCVDTDTIKKSRAIEEENLLPICDKIVDYSILQEISVNNSRNEEYSNLGCLLSDVGTTANIYLANNKDKYERKRIVAKVYKDDTGHELLKKEFMIMGGELGPNLIRSTKADFDNGILYMEQAIPLPELLASHYYKLSLHEFCNLLLDITSGLKDLFDHGIIYRDIHLNNIYLSSDPATGKKTYKLGDFGSCTFVNNQRSSARIIESGGVGSKWYMAPETFFENRFDERSSVYGVGMIAYYLLNDLYPPFWQEYGETSLKMRMQSSRLPIPTKLQTKEFSQLRIDFVLKSLNIDPTKRDQSLTELIESIKKCKSAYQDILLIEGAEIKTDAKKYQAETFCSTCGFNPAVLVSNGEIDSSTVNVKENWQTDILIFDENLDGQIDDIDTCSKINDFATTCHSSSHSISKSISHSKASCHYPSDPSIDEFAMTECSIPQKIAFDQSIDEHDWNSVNKSRLNELLDFIEIHPHSVHISEARNIINCHINKSSNSQENQYNYEPSLSKKTSKKKLNEGSSFWTRLFRKKRKLQSVYSSVFAPAEVSTQQHMMVQVYLHLLEETNMVKSLAIESDKNAERKGFEPLEVKLKTGDKVEIELNIHGVTLLYNCRKPLTWSGSFVKRSFDYLVPSNINSNELSCSINIYVNGALAGEMLFLTKIVESPHTSNTKVFSRPTKKLFISYSHKDIKSAEKIAKIHEALGIEVFFDKHRLKSGYIFSEEIFNFINTADTFVLCWSENAAQSEYVDKERKAALKRAYPNCKPREEAQIRIKPYNIEPYATAPSDMIHHYHFEKL